MTDVAGAEPLTDDAILELFTRTRNQPTGSQTLGLKITAVSQAERTVEAEFEARATGGGPGTLPIPHSSFVGRDAELGQLFSLLRGRSRL